MNDVVSKINVLLIETDEIGFSHAGVEGQDNKISKPGFGKLKKF